MTQIANIVINDGEATPVAHTFAPDGNSGLEANFADRASGISIGFPKLKFAIAKADGKNQPLNKVRIRLTVPKLEVISGSAATGFTPAARLAYLGTFDGNFIFHERATAQDRKNIRVLLVNLLGHAATVDTIDNLSPQY
jgi:hypothetical protein